MRLHGIFLPVFFFFFLRFHKANTSVCVFCSQFTKNNDWHAVFAETVNSVCFVKEFPANARCEGVNAFFALHRQRRE